MRKWVVDWVGAATLALRRRGIECQQGCRAQQLLSLWRWRHWECVFPCVEILRMCVSGTIIGLSPDTAKHNDLDLSRVGTPSDCLAP